MLTILEIAGILASLAVFYLIATTAWNFLFTCFIGDALGKSLKVGELGKWAVVTGASDGIGRAYAEELAARGLNLVLISRSLYKLQNVAAEIGSEFNVKTRVIDVDFTGGPEIYEKIAREIADLEIGVLINNVGLSYVYPDYLAEMPNGVEFASSLINCNVLSVTRMSLMVLPQMVQRRKGLILNVSSASAVLPTPLMTMYSSTKAFVHKFSEDLYLEYKDFGVTVQCILPGFVATNMSRIRRPCLKAPRPRDFVRCQMKTLGLESASPGYWFHKIQLSFYLFARRLWPAYVVHVMRTGALKLREGGRKRALKLAQLSAKEQETKVVH